MINQRFVRNGEKYVMAGNKIRIFKKDLAEKTNIPASDIELIHNYVILENCQMVKHYNIPFEEDIWFGKLSDYFDEFGEHIVLTLKADYNPDALALTEKVLVKENDCLFRIRELLRGVYPWIEKVNMRNGKKQLLSDDQTIKECGLVEDPIIILKSQILVSTNEIKLDNSSTQQTARPTGNDDNNDKIVSDDEAMKLRNMFSFLTPIIERCQTYLDSKTPDGQSNMSKLMAYGKKDYKEVANENPDFSKLISGMMFSDFKKIENNVSNEGSQTLHNLFSGLSESPKDKDNAMTLQEGYLASQQIFEKCSKLSQRNKQNNMNPEEQQLIFNVMNELFRAIEKDSEVKNCPDKIVNGKMIKYINSFLDEVASSEGPINGEEVVKQLRAGCDKDKSELGCDVNSLLNDVWILLENLNNVACHNVNVIPNLNKDDSFRISSGTELTTDKVIEKLPNKENMKEVLLTTSKYDTFYDSVTPLPKDENIGLITVSRLENLEILDTLGKGGFGVVNLCRNKSNGERRAIKILEVGNEKKLKEIDKIWPEIIANFRMASHSRIIQYFDYYKENNQFFIEMEYMEGGSFRQYLVEHGALPEIDVRHFSRQVLEGLNYLHQIKSVVHGDIKPDNILLDKNKNIKLADFGLAKYFRKSIDDFKNLSMPRGTERYLAPEIQNNCDYGHSIDIWAFGVMVTEMVLGKLDDSKNDISIEKAKNKIKIDLPNTDSLSHFIDYCFKLKPEERWTSSQLLKSDFINGNEII